ncbi:hypothetical protein [uncultured Enterococcus sp.]|uniref:hypothetical protein n=1 Tax=uncultured Enterococcus sp. TaxID=167972 RepID=UPI002AA6C28D|nr:hypothetical protein [uncultured Enterococcus sp.]
MNKKQKRELFKKYIIPAELGDEEALRIIRNISKNSEEKISRFGKAVKVTFKSGYTREYWSIADCSRSINKSETAIKYCIDKGIIDSKGRCFERIQEAE